MIYANKYENLSYSQLLATTKHLDQIVRVYGTYINEIDESLTEFTLAVNDADKNGLNSILSKIKEKKRVKDLEYEQLMTTATVNKRFERSSLTMSGSNLFLSRDDTIDDEMTPRVGGSVDGGESTPSSTPTPASNTDFLASKFNQITDANRSLMSTSDFEKIAKEMTRLKKETKLFESYSELLNNHYDDMKKCLQESLNKRSSECDYVFRKELIDDNDIAKLNENEKYFSAALTNQRLHQHISLELIEATHQKFLDRIVIYVETLIQFVNENLLRMNKGMKLTDMGGSKGSHIRIFGVLTKFTKNALYCLIQGLIYREG